MTDGFERRGMVLVVTLAIVSLVALLAVATLSVSTRMSQGSSLAVRDASLSAASSYGLVTVLAEWRTRSLSSMGVGETRQFSVTIPGTSATAAATATATRLTREVYWIAAEATVADGSTRRESLVVRLRVPRLDSLPPLTAGGDVILSDRFSLTRDTVPGCAPAGPDLAIGPDASLSSRGGPLQALHVERSALATDSAFLLGIGGMSIVTLAATADLTLASGAVRATPSGVVHARGDLTLVSGAGEGILIVDGRLVLDGPISFVGIIIARGGIVAAAGGAKITGALRTGPAVSGGSADLQLAEEITIVASACASQAVITKAITPFPVAGRQWAEIF